MVFGPKSPILCVEAFPIKANDYMAGRTGLTDGGPIAGGKEADQRSAQKCVG